MATAGIRSLQAGLRFWDRAVGVMQDWAHTRHFTRRQLHQLPPPLLLNHHEPFAPQQAAQRSLLKTMRDVDHLACCKTMINHTHAEGEARVSLKSVQVCGRNHILLGIGFVAVVHARLAHHLSMGAPRSASSDAVAWSPLPAA